MCIRDSTYTDLEYTRCVQERGASLLIDLAVFNALSLDIKRRVIRKGLSHRYSLIAVSYTHLDVYKRQEEGGRNADAARQILKALKIRRLPTDEEEKLYDKWVREWGFSFGGIMAATAAMTKVQYPNRCL